MKIYLLILSTLFNINLIQAQKPSDFVSIELKNESLEEGLNQIKKKTGYKISYASELITEYKNISIEKKTRTVDNTLKILLKKTDLAYEISDTKIIIYKTDNKKEKQATAANNEHKRIKGIVKDFEDNPLPGVIIHDAETNRNYQTDANGLFNIELRSAGEITFTYMGYLTKTEKIDHRQVYVVKLEPNNNLLDELQVIGYGTTSKRLNTGAVSSITADELGKQSISNPLVGIQGRMPGIQISQDNGLSGASLRVNIRGINSLGTTGSIPLYIIDGVPFYFFSGSDKTYPNDNLNCYGLQGANGGISPLSMINPNDIERIDVLKDADATAIFGSRAANGVIVITTKKSYNTRTQFNIDFSKGIGKVSHFIPMLNKDEYLTMRKEAYTNAGITPGSEALDLTSWDQRTETDWQKWALGGTANSTNASLSASGGTTLTRFWVSGTYREQGTVYPGNYNNKTASGRVTLNHKSANGKLCMALTANYNRQSSTLPVTDLSKYFYLPPNFKAMNDDGRLNWDIGTNPLASLMRTNKNKISNLISNFTISYEIAKGLKFKTNSSYSYTNLNQASTNPASSQDASGSDIPLSTLDYADNTFESYLLVPQIEYTLPLFRGELQTLAGTTFHSTRAN